MFPAILLRQGRLDMAGPVWQSGQETGIVDVTKAPTAQRLAAGEAATPPPDSRRTQAIRDCRSFNEQNSLPLDDAVDAVYFRNGDRLDGSTGPVNFQSIDPGAGAQAKMHSQVGAGGVAPATVDVRALPRAG